MIKKNQFTITLLSLNDLFIINIIKCLPCYQPIIQPIISHMIMEPILHFIAKKFFQLILLL